MRDFGGYLTKRGTVDCGVAELRVHTEPPRNVPGYSRTTGFYIDNDAHETATPCLVRLSHGRFLPGWTLGVGMATTFALSVETDETEAWQRAFAMTGRMAEEERDWQWRVCRECWERERRGLDCSDRCAHPELCDTCYTASPDFPLALHATT